MAKNNVHEKHESHEKIRVNETRAVDRTLNEAITNYYYL